MSMPTTVVLLVLAVLAWPTVPRAAARLADRAQRPTPGADPEDNATPGAAARPVERHVAGLAAPFHRATRALEALAHRRGLRSRAPAPTSDDAWAVDLLAAAYAAGLDTASALRAVSEVAPGPAAESFAVAAAHVGLGQDVAGAWGPAIGTSAVIPRVREALGQSANSGGSVTDSLRRASTWSRARAASARKAAAERAGVLIAAPLGACFLPAFVCLGVAPVVVGLARQILPEVFA